MKVAISISLYLGLVLLFNTTFAQEPPPSIENEKLKSTIDHYLGAWKTQDLKTMRHYESWEGGIELGEIRYIQSFSPEFQIHQWKITKIISLGNDEYKVMILMTQHGHGLHR